MKAFDDKSIIAKLAADDRKLNDEALNHLYRKNYETIANLVKRNNGSASDGADVFQDALIVLYNQVKRQELNLNCSLSTYLYSVSRNLWLNKLRQKNWETSLTDQHEFVPIPENQMMSLIRDEKGEILLKLIQQLGEECRKLLVYFYYERIKIKKIVSLLGFGSEQSVKNKKAKCVKRLKEMAAKNVLFQDYFS